jgi:hypothetical protein
MEIWGPRGTPRSAPIWPTAPLKFLAAGYADPQVVKRLGRTRLARFCYRHSRGAWAELQPDALLVAAHQSLELWADSELDYPDLAEDIAIEARLALLSYPDKWQLEGPDVTSRDYVAVTRLGAPFKVYDNDIPPFRVEVAMRIADLNSTAGLPRDWPIPSMNCAASQSNERHGSPKPPAW